MYKKIIFLIFSLISINSMALNISDSNNITFYGNINVVKTNQYEYLGAPFINLITVTNNGPVTSSVPWSLTNAYMYVYLGTGSVTVAPDSWPSNRAAEIYMDVICTGRPNFILPSNAVRFVNGTYTNLAPSLGTNNTLYFYHSPYKYWYWAVSNDLSTGTP